MKPYPSYKDSGVEWIGEIPSEWEKTKLKYISEIITGNTPPKKDEENYEGGENLWVKPDELNGFYPTNETKEKLTEKGKSLSRMIPPHSVFVNGIGNIGRFGFSEMEVSTNQQINSVVLNEKCISRFGLYLTSAMEDEFQKQSEKVVVSILSKSRQENVETVIPPLSEQKQIVSFLDHKTQLIDSLIKKTGKKIELLKEQRISLINHCVTKGLDPNVEMKDIGVEWIGEIPSHWEVRKLKYFSDVYSSSVDRHVYENELQVSICHYPDVYNNEFINENVELNKGSCNEVEFDRFHLKEGLVILTKDSESPDDIGIPSYVEANLNNVVCGYHLSVIKKNKNYINSKFLFRFIQSDIVRCHFEVNSKGITRFGLSKSIIENLFVDLPPFPEQQLIVDYLDEQTQKIDTTIENETQRIELLKEYRQALISQVVTGKIDVRDEVVV
jgi:type I restriction enzyme, S subunit